MDIAVELLKVPGNVPALVICVVILLGLLVYQRELRGLLRGPKQIKIKDFAAEFDQTVKDAFTAATAAVEEVWKLRHDRKEDLIDPDLYFSDSHFDKAKELASLMPVRSWSPITRLRVRRKIRSLVYDLADRYRKVRAEPLTDDRTKRLSAVVAQMRLLTFAAYPMLGELIAADRAGARVAAIAFLQVKPCFKVSTVEWLGKRISLEEGRFVQYHAAGALLVACHNAERGDMEVLSKVIKDARLSCGELPDEHRSKDAPKLLEWCENSLGANPYSMNAEEV